MARKKVFIATRMGMHIGKFDTRSKAEVAIEADKKSIAKSAADGWCSADGWWWDIRVQ